MLILVVDDEKDQVKSICLGLRSKGFKTLEAYHANQALRHLNNSSSDIDVVITDYIMPEMNGMELLKRIKKNCTTIPVIMISANGTDELIREAFYHGCESYLDKPFTIEELLLEIKRIAINKNTTQ